MAIYVFDTYTCLWYVYFLYYPRQKQFETMDHLHSLLASVRLVHVDRKEVLHLLSSTLSSIKDSQSVVMKAVSSHICRSK